jgi:hypothetical protein
MFVYITWPDFTRSADMFVAITWPKWAELANGVLYYSRHPGTQCMCRRLGGPLVGLDGPENLAPRRGSKTGLSSSQRVVRPTELSRTLCWLLLAYLAAVWAVKAVGNESSGSMKGGVACLAVRVAASQVCLMDVIKVKKPMVYCILLSLILWPPCLNLWPISRVLTLFFSCKHNITLSKHKLCCTLL